MTGSRQRDAEPDEHVCPECGQPNRLDARFCWLCGRAFANPELNAIPTPPPLPPSVKQPASVYDHATMAIAVGFLVVGAGLTQTTPGLGILFAIVAVPALIMSGKKLQKKGIQAGESATTSEKVWAVIGTVVSSVALTSAIVTALVIAGCAALFISCKVMMGS